ncbi:hypothetical protein BGW38_005117 [Lunasporangiospora selenospora]|uniref:Uncharacterized protein n=1 Tax=Lunasporangiospora selenospora TaxID=979761 RepID=A0A9P6KHE0_9FUNG|nr:hypothetical protein BGW38_005117 [Lunasporangiospora selenospora]
MSPPTPVVVEYLTPRHVAYLGLMHMLGAMLLDGIINFALGSLMFSKTKSPIMLWGPLPNSLAADAAFTLILQTTFTWFLDRLAVRNDLKKGLVEPLSMPVNAHPWLRWFVGLDDDSADDYSGNNRTGGGYGRVGERRAYSRPHHNSSGAGSSRGRSRRGSLLGIGKSDLQRFQSRGQEILRFHGKRIGVLIVASFIVFWPITMVILTVMKASGVGRDDGPLKGDFNVWPFPEVFKGIYGFLTGIITPLISYIALIYEGESMIRFSSLDSEDEEEDEENEELFQDSDEEVMMEQLDRVA